MKDHIFFFIFAQFVHKMLNGVNCQETCKLEVFNRVNIFCGFASLGKYINLFWIQNLCISWDHFNHTSWNLDQFLLLTWFNRIYLWKQIMYLCLHHWPWHEQVPIQVHRSLAYSDGIRSVEPARMAIAAGMSDGLLFTELDRYCYGNLFMTVVEFMKAQCCSSTGILCSTFTGLCTNTFCHLNTKICT